MSCCNFQTECRCMPYSQFYDAGPIELTGEYNIGTRKCSEGLKRCTFNGMNWCTNKKKCSIKHLSKRALGIHDSVFMPELGSIETYIPITQRNNGSSKITSYAGIF